MQEQFRTSTKGMSVGNFQPHGEMDLYISGNLNILEARGPFNRELVIAAGKAQEQLDHLLASRRHWGTLLVFKDSALTSREALSEITSILKRRAGRGIKPSAVGIVLDEAVEGGRLMAKHFAMAYADAEILVRIFVSLDEARLWILKVLDRCDSAEHPTQNESSVSQ